MIETQPFITAICERHPGITVYSRKALLEFGKANGFKENVVGCVIRSAQSAGRGVYDLSATVIKMPQKANKPSPVFTEESTYIPDQANTYVKWGHAKDVETIINSKMFYPVYITGLSGNGKTMMVEQACAECKREYIRIQITPETDEDDLIGGFRLVNGETVFAKGPVIKAMEAGAILLIDEIDRGSNKLMALQGILEGKPVLIKKTGEVVVPVLGFNIIATSNTKGKGSEDGRFISANIIDEAFLERFAITMIQPYPNIATEKKIVNKHMQLFHIVDKDFVDNLTKWSAAIRKTFIDGGVDDVISTRRLCHIVQSFAIFGKHKKAIELCVSRFDDDTRVAFIDLYKKIDVSATETETEVDEETDE